MKELSLHILDLVENSIKAGASRISIEIEEDEEQDRLTIWVRDNGEGMTKEEARKALDPFYTTNPARRFGLGLPLLAAACERSAGWLKLDSRKGFGTVVQAVFSLSHIDRAPIGDLATTLLVLVMGNAGVRIIFTYRRGLREFMLDSEELAENVSPQQIKKTIAAGLARIRGGESDSEG